MVDYITPIKLTASSNPHAFTQGRSRSISLMVMHNGNYELLI